MKEASVTTPYNARLTSTNIRVSTPQQRVALCPASLPLGVGGIAVGRTCSSQTLQVKNNQELVLLVAAGY